MRRTLSIVGSTVRTGAGFVRLLPWIGIAIVACMFTGAHEYALDAFRQVWASCEGPVRDAAPWVVTAGAAFGLLQVARGAWKTKRGLGNVIAARRDGKEERGLLGHARNAEAVAAFKRSLDLPSFALRDATKRATASWRRMVGKYQGSAHKEKSLQSELLTRRGNYLQNLLTDLQDTSSRFFNLAEENEDNLDLAQGCSEISQYANDRAVYIEGQLQRCNDTLAELRRQKDQQSAIATMFAQAGLKC